MTIFCRHYHRVWLIVLLCLCSAGVSAQGIAKGADVSWLNQQAANNPPQVFRDAAGNTTDFIKLFKDVGGNAIRLRVWVNPFGGWNDGRDTLDKAKRAAAQGMRIMIDFHYSDSWADPGKQTKPAAWAGHSVAQLNTDVYSHTQGILKYLKDNGITVSWVQVGNEINSGMLWNEGKTPNFATLGQFINSGYTATKAVYPNAKVVLHLANGYDNANFRWFFDNLRSAGGKWDVIGMSHYPPVGSWQDYNSRLDTNMRDMIARYGSDVVISEVGMDWQQAATTRAMLSNLLSRSSIGARPRRVLLGAQRLPGLAGLHHGRSQQQRPTDRSAASILTSTLPRGGARRGAMSWQTQRPRHRVGAPPGATGFTDKAARAQVRSYGRACTAAHSMRQRPAIACRCPSSFGRTPAAPAAPHRRFNRHPGSTQRTTASHSIRTRSEEWQQVRAVHLGVHEFTMSTHPRGVSPRER